MKRKKFFELYKEGKIGISDVSQYVKEWKDNYSDTMCLFEYLGV